MSNRASAHHVDGRTDADTEPHACRLESSDALDVLAGVGGAVYDWDIASDRLTWTGAAETLLGVPAQRDIATGRRFARLVDPSGPPGRYDAVFGSERHDTGEGVGYEAEYRLLPPGERSEPLWIEDCGRWFAGPDGRPARARGVLRVVNTRRAQQARLLFHCDHDPASGALNRRRLGEELGTAIDRAVRQRSACALAVIALDNLGALNMAYGFAIGDELMAGVVARLSGTIRGGDSVGRLSGNKIGIVLSTCTASELYPACERYARTVSDAPVETSAGGIAITVSIGGVMLPRYGATVAEGLARAEEALADARGRGIGGLVLFDPQPGREAARRRNVALAGEVVDALKAGRVQLALQPIVGAADRQPAMQEALCRVHTAEGAPISAGDFIETAERLGIIRMVDHRTLELAAATLAADPRLRLSINVAAASALDGAWFAALAAHIRRDRTLAARLTVEFTETMAIHDLDRAVDFVRGLRDLGCRVAIDDFGAGHTSFRNLRALAVDLVKIDGSFVENVADSADDLYFVSTLVRLARHMGLETVAERVSREADAAVLTEAGLDYLQGHLFGEAEIRDDAAEALRQAG